MLQKWNNSIPNIVNAQGKIKHFAGDYDLERSSIAMLGHSESGFVRRARGADRSGTAWENNFHDTFPTLLLWLQESSSDK